MCVNLFFSYVFFLYPTQYSGNKTLIATTFMNIFDLYIEIFCGAN